MPEGSSFAKLNETNYHEWRILMEALLIKRGYWEIVEGTVTTPVGSVNHKTVQAFIRRRNEAYAELIFHVEPAPLSSLVLSSSLAHRRSSLVVNPISFETSPLAPLLPFHFR
jgi:hypothetical protein